MGREWNVKIHVKHSHLSKKYICVSCKKQFAKAELHKKHEMKCSGLILFSCQFCERKFQSRSVVKKHELIHTGEKPHHCHRVYEGEGREAALTSIGKAAKRPFYRAATRPYQNYSKPG